MAVLFVMDKKLSERLNSLPLKERRRFYRRLMDVLNDRYSSFVYGGISKKEYATLPKEKVERVENIIYQELFGGELFPDGAFTYFSSSLN